MKRNFIAAALCALCLCAQMSAAAQDKPKAQPATAAKPQAPAEELKAAQAVAAAADGALALAAAAEFVKKYPKSTLRMDVARVAADKVSATTDAALRVTHGEGYLKIFTAPEEANLINPLLVRDYVTATRLDDAYRVGALAAVEKFDDPLGTMIFLSLIGENEVRRGNGKYLEQSRQLAARAAELIETDKRPASLDDATWANYKTTRLPQLYNALATLAFVSKDVAGAKAYLAKAVAVNSAEPTTYILLGSIADQEYRETATAYRAATGAAQSDLLKKGHEQRDRAIEAFAQAIALTEGNAGYDQLRPQLMEALESHYKNRPGGSPEAMKQLIDKYKKPKT